MANILLADHNMELITVINPSLPDGHLLSLDLGECPVWWKKGKSFVFVAYRQGKPSNYIADLSTGIAVLLELEFGVLRRLSASSDPYMFIGSIEPSYRDCSCDSSEHLFCVSPDNKILDMGYIPKIGSYQSVAISPDTSRIALIERDTLKLSIFNYRLLHHDFS